MFERAADRWQAALLLAALLLGLWAWGQLPPGAQVAIHFSVQGVPDGWGSPAMGFLVMPGVAAAMWGLRELLDKAELRAGVADRERAARVLDQIFLAMAVLFATVQLIIVVAALTHWRPAASHFLLPLAFFLLATGCALLRLVDPRDPQLAPSCVHPGTPTFMWANKVVRADYLNLLAALSRPLP